VGAGAGAGREKGQKPKFSRRDRWKRVRQVGVRTHDPAGVRSDGRGEREVRGGQTGVVMESGFAQAAQFPEVKGGRLDNTGSVAAVARPWHRRIVRERAE